MHTQAQKNYKKGLLPPTHGTFVSSLRRISFSFPYHFPGRTGNRKYYCLLRRQFKNKSCCAVVVHDSNGGSKCEGWPRGTRARQQRPFCLATGVGREGPLKRGPVHYSMGFLPKYARKKHARSRRNIDRRVRMDPARNKSPHKKEGKNRCPDTVLRSVFTAHTVQKQKGEKISAPY